MSDLSSLNDVAMFGNIRKIIIIPRIVLTSMSLLWKFPAGTNRLKLIEKVLSRNYVMNNGIINNLLTLSKLVNQASDIPIFSQF